MENVDRGAWITTGDGAGYGRRGLRTAWATDGVLQGLLGRAGRDKGNRQATGIASRCSRRMIVDFDTGVLLTSAVESRGTSTFASGK